MRRSRQQQLPARLGGNTDDASWLKDPAQQLETTANRSKAQ